MTISPKYHFAIPCAVALWLAVCTASLLPLWMYQASAGQLSEFHADWPTASIIQRKDNQPVLLMFLHPQCPCSRASVEEFSQIVKSANHPLTACIIIYAPESQSTAWHRSNLWKLAEQIDGVHLIADRNGEQARLFDAQTSGQAYLFNAAGELQFKGGITVSRGHQGDNEGRQAIVERLQNLTNTLAKHHVYGCSILQSCSQSSVADSPEGNR